MTNLEQPPTMPFTDDDGYYVRDPKSAAIRTDEQLRAFDSHLLMLANGVDALTSLLSSDQQALSEPIISALAAVRGDSNFLMALTNELAAYNTKLTEQRQSARDTFNQGWDARLDDILSQLHPADHRMLIWILKHLDVDDRAESEQLKY